MKRVQIIVFSLVLLLFSACSDDGADDGAGSSVAGSSSSAESSSASPYSSFIETFDNFTEETAYNDGSFTGNQGIVWSYWQAKGDQPLDGKAVCTKSNLSATIPGGIGKLSFKVGQPHSDIPNLELYINGVKAGGPYTAAGEYWIMVAQTNSCTLVFKANGMRTTIDTIGFSDAYVVETTPPQVTVTSPGETLQAYNLIVSGSAVDPGEVVSGVAAVYVKLDSNPWVKADGTGNWSYDYGAVSEGGHTFSVYAVDKAGNCSATNSVAVSVTHPSDSSAPSVAINATGRTISGTASDDYGVQQVLVRLDGGSWETAAGRERWSIVPESLSPGTHTVEVKAVDYAGNETAIPVSRSFSVDMPAWTIMIYLDADNDLEGAGLDDFNEMEKGLYDAIQVGNTTIQDNVNIIVLLDRHPGYSSAEGNWADTRLFKILPDNNLSAFASTRLDDGGSGAGHIPNLGEKKMDDPATLSWFLNYGKQNFPALHYGLILWNHGGGARSLRSVTKKTTRPLRDVCWDETSGSWAPLYTDEIQQAVAANFSSADKLAFIGFDACLMGMLEVGYEFRNLARYMVASMQTEQEDGWDYAWILNNIGNGTLQPRDLVKKLVEAYKVFIEANGSDSGETLAATDLGGMEQLKTAVDALAVALYNENKKSALETVRDSCVNYMDSDPLYSEYSPFYDLYDFCNRIVSDSVNGFSTNLQQAAQTVIDCMSDTMVSCYGETGNGQSYYFASDADAKRGLSVFFASSTLDYANQGWYTVDDNRWKSADGTEIYGNIDFADYSTDGTVRTWRDLMDAWY